MSDKFLNDLQEDILDKKGIYVLYVFLFVLSFIITIEEIKLYFHIVRIILSFVSFLFLFLIYFKCKSTRDIKQNKIILKHIVLFIILLFATVFQFIKNII